MSLEATRETTAPLQMNRRLFRLASGVAKTEWRCWHRVAKMCGAEGLGTARGKAKLGRFKEFKAKISKKHARISLKLDVFG